MLLKMKLWKQCPSQEVPKYQGWEKVHEEGGFYLPHFLYCFCCERLDTATAGLGALAPGCPFWDYNTQIWSTVNWIPAQNFEFSFSKANQFWGWFRYRSSESLSWQMTGNHIPSETTRAHHPTAAAGEEQAGFLWIYISTSLLVPKIVPNGSHLTSPALLWYHISFDVVCGIKMGICFKFSRSKMVNASLMFLLKLVLKYHWTFLALHNSRALVDCFWTNSWMCTHPGAPSLQIWSFPFSPVMEAWKKTRESEKLIIRRIKELINTFFFLICSQSWMEDQLCCSVTQLLGVAMHCCGWWGTLLCIFSIETHTLRSSIMSLSFQNHCSILMSISDSDQYWIIHRGLPGAPNLGVWPTDHTQKMFDAGDFLVFI